ncbi:hypothetical protein ACFQV4_28460 [Streptomyces thermocarboxydus]
MIAYMDTVGVYFPRGGMHALRGQWRTPPPTRARTCGSGGR